MAYEFLKDDSGIVHCRAVIFTRDYFFCLRVVMVLM